MKTNRLFLVGGSALLLPLLVGWAPWYPLRLIASLALICFLPGYTLLSALWPQANSQPFNGLEQGLLASATSFGLTILLMLGLIYARLPLGVFSVAGSLAGIALLLALVAWRRQSAISATEVSEVRSSGYYLTWTLIVLFLAALFRIVNVHYSDYQGDEADIALRAVSTMYGRPEAILTHSKGPGEILVLAAVGALTGRFDELTTRLPFALAGTISVGLIVLVGGRLFDRSIGIVAGLLAAIDGVFVSYARTAQYQSLVLLLTLAAIWSFFRFYRTGGCSHQLHGLGTFLLAAAILVHFEVFLLLPVATYLAVAPVDWPVPGSVGRRLSLIGRSVFRLWPSVILFVAMVAAFYIPFLFNPAVEKTGTYLENRIRGGSLPPFNNLDHFFYFEALKYNSAYYVLFFNLLLVGVVIVTLISVFHPSNVWVGYAGGLAVASVGLALAGYEQAAALIAGLGAALFLGIAIMSKRTRLPDRVLWLWLAPPFLAYVFLVNRPGKHHYIFLAALVIFAGLALVSLYQKSLVRWPTLKSSPGRWLAAGIFGALLALFAGHSTILFLRSDLEYVLTYPAHRSSLYPTDTSYPYGARIGFGYPFRLGWQTVGLLKRTGQLNGTWAGNDDGNAPNWYMLNTPATPCYPDYVLRGEITYKGDKDFDVPFEPVDFGYAPLYRIWGNDRLRMTILEFNPDRLSDRADRDVGQVIDLYEPFYFEQPVSADDFMDTLSTPLTPTPQTVLQPAPVLGEGSEIKNNAPPAYLERAQLLAGRVWLIGYDLDERYAYPGGIVPVTLYWQSQQKLSLRYKVFVHLTSAAGDRTWTQADNFPVCGALHANNWTEGQVVPDRHLLKLPPDILPGVYTLHAGMYEPELNLRLNYFDVAGNEQGNSISIGSVTVRP